MKVQWDKFYNPYCIIMNILKDSYAKDDNISDNVMTTDILNFIRGT